jgi:hypothetical protein
MPTPIVHVSQAQTQPHVEKHYISQKSANITSGLILPVSTAYNGGMDIASSKSR